MNKIVIVFLLLAHTLLLGNNNPKSETTSFERQNYFPISPKIKLVYDSSFGEVTNSMQMNNDTLQIVNQAEDFYYAQKMLLQNDSVMVLETHQKLSVLLFINKESIISYQTPLLRIPFPLPENASWESSTTQFSGKYKSQVSMAGTMIDREKIKTKFGTFDAIKLVTSVKTNYGSENIVTEWYAKNIGLVKAEIQVKGGGFTGFLRDILGYDLITFELSDIKYES